MVTIDPEAYFGYILVYAWLIEQYLYPFLRFSHYIFFWFDLDEKCFQAVQSWYLHDLFKNEKYKKKSVRLPVLAIEAYKALHYRVYDNTERIFLWIFLPNNTIFPPDKTENHRINQSGRDLWRTPNS